MKRLNVAFYFCVDLSAWRYLHGDIGMCEQTVFNAFERYQIIGFARVACINLERQCNDEKLGATNLRLFI
ncbi:hypothetical protein ACA29_05275 [Lederbergia galactosidilytica]|uniref:Uncharacterized protein n=1 Tax=Lederbergia galactosidilytica TaxID=217031 RepID=A0A0Q9Y367_9BACI|nr:hypothetical protein ACA29_05275 [Lederbergia galactosidilytica]